MVTTNNISRKRSNMASDQTSSARKIFPFLLYCLKGGRHKIKTIYKLEKKVFRRTLKVININIDRPNFRL